MRKFLFFGLFLIIQTKTMGSIQELPSDEKEQQCKKCYEIIFHEDSELMFNEHHQDPSFVETDLISEATQLLENFKSDGIEAYITSIKSACTTILKYWEQNPLSINFCG